MKYRFTLLAILLAPAFVAAQSSEEKAVRAAVEQYFRGHSTGSSAEMRKAFLPTAHVEGNRDGKFVSWTAEEYSSRFSGKPAADEVSRNKVDGEWKIANKVYSARPTK